MERIKHNQESENEPNQGPHARGTKLSHGEPKSVSEGAQEERGKLSGVVKTTSRAVAIQYIRQSIPCDQALILGSVLCRLSENKQSMVAITH
jgi:hypothetical protein